MCKHNIFIYMYDTEIIHTCTYIYIYSYTSDKDMDLTQTHHLAGILRVMCFKKLLLLYNKTLAAEIEIFAKELKK